jgi:hypothetical protein
LLGRVRAVRRNGHVVAIDTVRLQAVGWLVAAALVSLNWVGADGRLLTAPRRQAARAGRALLAVFRALACRLPIDERP